MNLLESLGVLCGLTVYDGCQLDCEPGVPRCILRGYPS